MNCGVSSVGKSNKLGILVSAFPGCGKTWMAQHSGKYDILDLDSADFHWFDKENRTKNIYFPSNYLRYALAELEKYDFVFISTHKEVRDYIREHMVVNQPGKDPYFVVYPEPTESNRGTWLNRIRGRKGAQDDSLIAGLASHWYDWLDELSMDTTPVHYVLDCNNTPYSNGMWIDDRVLGNLEAIAKDLEK